LAVVLPLALPACAGPAPASAASAPPVVGLDLGGSTSLMPARAVAVGEGHERAAPSVAVARRAAAPQLAHEGHRGTHATGVVKAIDAAKRTLTISHGPIPEIGWPAMTMDFTAAPGIDLGAIKPGTRVDFTLEKGAGGLYELRSIQPAGGAR
jgi:Cu/Ag efflux protein CusF